MDYLYSLIQQGDALEEMELDDLYNDLRVFEAEVEAKHPKQSSSINAAFVTTTGSVSNDSSSEGVKQQEGKEEVTT